MCLITEQKESKIATEDIVCYKEVYTLDKKTVCSTMQGFKYKLNTLYNTNILVYKGKTDIYADTKSERYYKRKAAKHLITITEGFHSINTLERYNENEEYDISQAYKCIIPKGSEYYEDATGLLCSNQIIIKEIVD